MAGNNQELNIQIGLHATGDAAQKTTSLLSVIKSAVQAEKHLGDEAKRTNEVYGSRSKTASASSQFDARYRTSAQAPAYQPAIASLQNQQQVKSQTVMGSTATGYGPDILRNVLGAQLGGVIAGTVSTAVQALKNSMTSQGAGANQTAVLLRIASTLDRMAGETYSPLAAPFRNAKGYANGGLVDTEPAMLTKGEFVVNPQATAANLPTLRYMNAGGVVEHEPEYLARGGIVGNLMLRARNAVRRIGRRMRLGSFFVPSTPLFFRVPDVREDEPLHTESGFGSDREAADLFMSRHAAAVRDRLSENDLQNIKAWHHFEVGGALDDRTKNEDFISANASRLFMGKVTSRGSRHELIANRQKLEAAKKAIREAMANAPLGQDVVLHRGMMLPGLTREEHSLENLQRMVGQSISTSHETFASALPQIADRYASGGGTHSFGVRTEIRMGRGSKALPISELSSDAVRAERAMLMPRSDFRIAHVSNDADGVPRVVLDLVAQRYARGGLAKPQYLSSGGMANIAGSIAQLISTLGPQLHFLGNLGTGISSAGGFGAVIDELKAAWWYEPVAQKKIIETVLKMMDQGGGSGALPMPMGFARGGRVPPESLLSRLRSDWKALPTDLSEAFGDIGRHLRDFSVKLGASPAARIGSSTFIGDKPQMGYYVPPRMGTLVDVLDERLPPSDGSWLGRHVQRPDRFFGAYQSWLGRSLRAPMLPRQHWSWLSNAIDFAPPYEVQDSDLVPISDQIEGWNTGRFRRRSRAGLPGISRTIESWNRSTLAPVQEVQASDLVDAPYALRRRGTTQESLTSRIGRWDEGAIATLLSRLTHPVVQGASAFNKIHNVSDADILPDQPDVRSPVESWRFGWMKDRAGYFAQGGMGLAHMVSGPRGTDKIPAWLTEGEWVVPAAATRRYRSFLEAITNEANGRGRGILGGDGASLKPKYLATGGPSARDVWDALHPPQQVTGRTVMDSLFPAPATSHSCDCASYWHQQLQKMDLLISSVKGGVGGGGSGDSARSPRKRGFLDSVLDTFGIASNPLTRIGAGGLVAQAGIHAASGLMNSASGISATLQNSDLTTSQKIRSLSEGLPVIGGLVASFNQLKDVVSGVTETLRRNELQFSVMAQTAQAVNAGRTQQSSLTTGALQAREAAVSQRLFPVPGYQAFDLSSQRVQQREADIRLQGQTALNVALARQRTSQRVLAAHTQNTAQSDAEVNQASAAYRRRLMALGVSEADATRFSSRTASGFPSETYGQVFEGAIQRARQRRQGGMSPGSAAVAYGSGGAVGGALVGAAIGSVVPGIGTAVGAGVGGLLGGGGIGWLAHSRYSSDTTANAGQMDTLFRRAESGLSNFSSALDRHVENVRRQSEAERQYAEDESRVRKARIQQMQGEVQILQDRANRMEQHQQSLGGMGMGGIQQGAAALRGVNAAVRRGGIMALQYLPQEMLSAAAQFDPGRGRYLREQLGETLGRRHAPEFGQEAGSSFADFRQHTLRATRDEMQRMRADIQVQIQLDEVSLATKIGEAVERALRPQLERVFVSARQAAQTQVLNQQRAASTANR